MNALFDSWFPYLLVLIVWLLSAEAMARDLSYDPLTIAAPFSPTILDITVNDPQRQRAIPIRVYLPEESAPEPVILFSHGLGGSRTGSAYLGRHWAGRGYVVVFLQHPGSDSAVWQDQSPAQRMDALRQAANLRNFRLRVKDVPAVLDQLAVWNQAPRHALTGRLDLRHIGMSGHSFGAITTQAVSGQAFFHGQISFTDLRIRAALAFSPSSPRWGSAQQAFGNVQIPWMLMTGSKDLAPIGGATLDSRRAVFSALPTGGKYELVLDRAEHSVFTDRPLPGDREPRNPNHHRVILALSTAFWDAWLRQDKAAREWLEGAGSAAVLEQADRWQRK